MHDALRTDGPRRVAVFPAIGSGWLILALLLGGCCSIAGTSQRTVFAWERIEGSGHGISLPQAERECRAEALALCAKDGDAPDICADLAGPRYFHACMRRNGFEQRSTQVRACRGMKLF